MEAVPRQMDHTHGRAVGRREADVYKGLTGLWLRANEGVPDESRSSLAENLLA